MQPAIEVANLTKSYGGVAAVAGVSFSVEPGSIFGYLGRNGSGKTTTVRILSTLTRADGGSARVAGFDVGVEPLEVRSRIGVTMQDAALDPQMTGIQHLRFIAGVLGHSRRAGAARSNELLELFGLTEAAKRAIGTYSGGMKRRLDIATALLGEPSVLFLDEPTTGLDPQSRLALWGEIRRLNANGVTVFLTTQYLEEADQLADDLAVIDGGTIIASGPAYELKAEHGRKQISFSAATTGPEAVRRMVFDHPLDITSTPDRICIEVSARTPDKDVLRLVGDLAEELGGLTGLEIADTSLEDVFLRLTGTAINDPGRSMEPAP